MHKVTIGLPVYNGENYLAAAIESILTQTFGDFDLIISDNASTDGTEEICRRYADRDRRIVYVRQARNLGAVANFNSIFPRATGTYFKWAAHDDLLRPRFLAECVRALDADPSLVLASPGTALIDEEDQPLPLSATKDYLIDRQGMRYELMPEKNQDLVSPDPVARFRALVYHTILCVEVFGLIRKSVLDGVPLQGSYLGSDKVFLSRLCLRGPFWMGEEPLFLRRCHGKQYSAVATSGNFRARWFGNGSSLSQGIVATKLTFLTDYCRSIANAPLTTAQRRACLAIVANRAVLRGRAFWRAKGLEGLYRSSLDRDDGRLSAASPARAGSIEV